MSQNTPRATTLTDRALVRLSGEDVRGFLQGLVTSDLTGALPVWAGLLTPQGKCLFDFLVWGEGDDLLVDCETVAADDLIKRLAIYRLRRPITIERDPLLAVHWAKDGSEGVPTRVCRNSGGAGSLPPANRHPGGSNIASASASAKDGRNLAVSSGSSATRRSLTA